MPPPQEIRPNKASLMNVNQWLIVPLGSNVFWMVGRFAGHGVILLMRCVGRVLDGCWVFLFAFFQ